MKRSLLYIAVLPLILVSGCTPPPPTDSKTPAAASAGQAARNPQPPMDAINQDIEATRADKTLTPEQRAAIIAGLESRKSELQKTPAN